ncbi:hypothetical protein BH11PSE2_BH11PSE2_07330 [soil metagenome]
MRAPGFVEQGLNLSGLRGGFESGERGGEAAFAACPKLRERGQDYPFRANAAWAAASRAIGTR